MKLGFIILAHNQPDAVRRLVDLLAGEGHAVVVHFDKNAPAEQHAAVRKLEQAYAGKVRIVSEVHCVWGEWSLVEAVLVALREFRTMESRPDYVHLMSGADFPIRPIADLEEFLLRNPDQDFIECCDITQRRWVKGGLSMERFRFYFPVNFRTSRKTFDRLVRWHRKLKIRRRIPMGMTPHMGSQWWTLRWSSCETILDFLEKNPMVIRYFRSTWIPDEAFFQTVLAHLVPREEIADLQLMLHHLTPTGRPYVFYPDHLPKLEQVPHFFVRKVAPDALDGLEEMVRRRQAPVPSPGDLAAVRDEVRGAIDRNYEHHAMVPGHAHGGLPERDFPAALVILTTSRAESALVAAHARAHPGALWAGCPLADDSIDLTAEMRSSSGLVPTMTKIRDTFPEQFVDTLTAALPSDRVAVFVVRYGDMACDPRLLSRMPGLRYVSAHPQLLPYELPGWRVQLEPLARIPKVLDQLVPARVAEDHAHWEPGSFLRTDHYFLLDAQWHGLDDQLPEVEFVLPSMPETVVPEMRYAQANDDGSQRVVMMFWVDDGAFLDIFPSNPAYLLSGDGAAPPVPLRHLGDFTVEKLLPILDSIGDPGIWSDRLVIEAVSHAPVADRFAFLLRAKDYWAEDVIAEHTGKLLPDDDASQPFFQLAAQVESVDEPVVLSDEVHDADPQNAEWGSVVHAIRVLAAQDVSKACALAIKAIGSREISSAELMEGIEPCFPRDSKWWPVALGKDPGLGAEQKADAMNCMGVAAFHKGDMALAELCYRAARQLCPEAQSSAWNMGLLYAAAGRGGEAAEAFGGVTRHYSNESICTAWPSRDGRPWPATAWPTDGVSLPDGVEEWPRISIITPSYNQAQYLEETIQSVLRQDYPNLQYIVVDGASDDGSKDILERYRDRIDHLIIEPDDGQTQAINKGLRLADGELVAWLNSDDVYGPGALHRIALHYLESGAEVIAGICAEHRAHTLQVINRPHATDRDFNPGQLAKIFPNWFGGMFFFQPEVFFSRALVERVGLLDESLYFAMDYDLWMRFAAAGARLQVVPWPTAFFRVHDAQKTSRSAECIAEQCVVRQRYYRIGLSDERQCQLARQLAPLRKAERPKFVLAGPAYEDVLHEAVSQSISGASLVMACGAGDPALVNAAAVIVLIGSKREEISLLQDLRKCHPDLLLVGWFMDSAHDPHANHEAARLVDVVIPVDARIDDYLRHDAALMMDPLPLASPLPIEACVTSLRALAVDHAAW